MINKKIIVLAVVACSLIDFLLLIGFSLIGSFFSSLFWLFLLSENVFYWLILIFLTVGYFLIPTNFFIWLFFKKEFSVKVQILISLGGLLSLSTCIALFGVLISYLSKFR